MKKLTILSFLFITSLLFNSCKPYNENEIKTTANNFLDAMHKPVDFKKMKANFNDFNFMSIPRVDEHKIRSIKEVEGEIIADVSTFFVTHNKEKITNDFLLKFKKIENVWKIVDSKGLASLEGFYPNAYKFAQKSNLLNDNLWDMEVLQIVKKTKKELTAIQESLEEMVEKNKKTNELVKRSDASAEEAKKAFQKIDSEK